MYSRYRSFAFAVLLLSLSSLVLVQSFHASDASTLQGSAPFSLNALIPLQNANSTASSQSLSANSTAQSANSTASSQVTTNSTSSSSSGANSTSLASSSANTASELSYMQYQMTSMSDQLVAMSSSMSSMNQQTGMNTLIAEGGLILGILAIVGAIAVAKRADSMYHEAPQGGQATGTPPGK